MKPDLGVHYQSSGYDQVPSIYFYDVPFTEIDLVGPDTFLVTLDHRHDGNLFALSFDFPLQVFFALLLPLNADELQSVKDQFSTQLAPCTIVLPRTITARVVECRLGSLQRSALTSEAFVPFVIGRIE